MKTDTKEIALKGVAASPGIVIGKAVVLEKNKVDIKRTSVPPERIEKEIADFKAAISRVKNDLLNLSVAVGKRLGPEYGRIFEAQAMIADDQVIISTVITQIREKKLAAAYLYYDQINQVIEKLSQSSDPYLKERILDINSVGTRLLGVLQGARQAAVRNIEGPTVVVAKYLAPSDLLGFSVRKKIGIALELGGVTSHTALLAKSLNLPAVVGIGPGLAKVNTGDRVIIDGYSGKLIANPNPDVVRKFNRRVSFLNDLTQKIADIKNRPGMTRDKRQVRVYNNIELPSETSKVIKSGAEGIGLFRTEYLFITEDSFPDFEKQYRSYKSILTKMKEAPVLIRTFDLGGDKFVADRLQTVDANPFLGWRAIRYCLDNPEVFKTQLKAILKASVFGNLGIMLPMISNIDELIKAKHLLNECKTELTAEGTKYKNDIPLGIMIEVPSAAILADKLASEVDFFSIGTNDLIQYTLAVDRTNEKLNALYQSFNPAVLNLIALTIKAARKHNIKVGVCGEMASDPLAAILFVGMGIDELSTSYLSTGMIKYIINNIDYKRADSIAKVACGMKTSSEVENYLKSKTAEYFPQLMPLVDFMQGLNHD